MSIGGAKAPVVKPGGQQAKGQQKGSQQKQGNGQAERQYLNGPLTLPRLRKETKASTNLAYRPTERAINAEKRASVQRTKDEGNWWNEYLATVQQGQGADQAAYNNAAQQGQAFIGQANAADSANTAKLDSQAAESAAVRGQSAPTQPAERAAAAQSQRNYLSAATGAATARQGANQFSYLGEQGRIGKGQSIAARTQEQARTRSIESDKRELAKQRGDYAAKFRGEEIEKNHDYLTQLRAFGLDKKKYGTEVAEAHTAATAAAQKAAQEAGQQGIENRQKQEEIGIERKKANGEAKGGKTQSERNEAQEGRKNATSAAQTLFEKKQWPSWGALTQAVAKESEVSPAEARAAVKRLREKVEAQQRKEKLPNAAKEATPHYP